jgi:TetR/AcrR family tetracycline transcriptional repressor
MRIVSTHHQRQTRRQIVPRRPRGSLSRAEILATALALVDREGLAALSMRALAEELGAGPMSLYNHIDGKHALLDGIVEALSDEIADNVTQTTGTTGGPDWARQLRAIASAFRTVGHAHPQALQLLATGFDDQHAVTAYRVFWSFLVGYVLAEIRASGEQVLERQLARLDPAAYPHTSALAKPLATRARDREFAQGLEAVLAGIAATLAPAG